MFPSNIPLRSVLASGALCFGLAACLALRAQNPLAALRGIVQDSSGARVLSATVAVDDSEQSFSRETHTDMRGEFRFEDLPPGQYKVRISATGFADARSEVTVALSSVRQIQATLAPKGIAEKVVVNAATRSITTEPIDAASAVHQAIIYQADLQSIPLAARSFANIAYLAPGTEPVEPSDPTKARITAVSTGGSSGLNNEISVDGGDNSDDYIGGFLQNFSPDAIQEFAFRTALAEADTGRTTAGSVEWPAENSTGAASAVIITPGRASISTATRLAASSAA